MNGDTIVALGYRPGRIVGAALKAAAKAQRANISEVDILATLKAILDDPHSFVDDPTYGSVAEQLVAALPLAIPSYVLDQPATYQIWGKQNIDEQAIAQIQRAVNLPITLRGALMPDAHVGYGLPIGGVLATDNSVIPYAVGVDIACRMRMTIFNEQPIALEKKRSKFREALEKNTVFGTGKTWQPRQDHEVMTDPLWREMPFLGQLKQKAWDQLGTSGSGNHFVEWGVLTVNELLETPQGTVSPGKYIALLSHSGSRRLGQEIANYYTQVAMEKRQGLPKDYLHLAWLFLYEGAGAEYWEAMNLAGRYASANHAIIHQRLVADMHMEVIGGLENHHNFAWKEIVDGREAIVHRKGATPATQGVLGVIPGSMSAPGFVVRGRGNVASLNSASHGAGRKMSRNEALKKFDWAVVKHKLKDAGVDLISAGLDEVPMAYKDIHQVMNDQADLVEIMAQFQPRIVKMDGSQGRDYHPED